MSDRHVVEVYRARNDFQAQLFVTALNEAGIKAEMQGTNFQYQGPTGISDPWYCAPRIVVFAEDAERAKRLLFELEARDHKETQEAETSPPIEAVCEECGGRASFPAAQRGSVQQCPHCGAYLDVPGKGSPASRD
jgi:hypothetical protein